MKKHTLRGTFLLQYDALIDPTFTDLILPLDPAQFEIGVWFETVQPQVEAAGLAWRGRLLSPTTVASEGGVIELLFQ